MKKGLLSMLALVLLAGVAIGCSGKVNEGGSEGSNRPSASSNEAEEPVTLTIFGGLINNGALQGPFQNDDVMAELEKRTNVKLDFTPTLNVTDASQKLAVMLAGKDLPDIVVFNALTDRDKVYNSGQALPLDDLVAQYGPDIQKNAGEALALYKQMNSDESHSLYYLPGKVGGDDYSPLVNQNAWNLRWDLYKQLSHPKLDTLDDLLDVLEGMMKLEPVNKFDKKNYGLGLNLSDDWGHLMIDKATANMRGMVQANYNDWYYDMSKQQIVPRVSDPEGIFWESMKFYNKAYQRGILDPESATLKFNAISEKYKTGRYFAATAYWSLAGADNQFIADGESDKGFAPFLVDHNEENIYIVQAFASGDQYQMFIPKNSKNPEAAMKFINYLYTYEGAKLLQNGVEGKQYDVANGVPLLKDSEIEASQNDPNHYLKTGVGKYIHLARFTPHEDPQGDPVNFTNVPETLKKMALPVQLDFMQHYGYDSVNEAFTNIPNYKFDTSLMSAVNPEAGSDIQAKKEQLDAYLVANIAKIIYQKTDDAYEKAKQDFLDAYSSKGAAEVFDYYKKTYDELVASLEP